MLRVNCKKAVENIKRYITDNFDCSEYSEIKEPTTFDAIAETIYTVFHSEKRYILKPVWALKMDDMTEYEIFRDWCQGLPSILDTCYYWNRSAIKDLGEILEETEEERNRFSESQSEEKLTQLIWREIVRGHCRCTV